MAVKQSAYAIHLDVRPPSVPERRAVPCKMRYLHYYFKEIPDKCFVNISERNM